MITCNAGHPAPLWYRAGDRSWRPLVDTSAECIAGIANLPLGVIEPTSYCQFAVPLELDDLVLIYTDSLPESKSPEGAMLGEEGLLEMVRGINADDPGQFCRDLLEALSEYRGGVPSDDDMTLVLLRHNAANPPKQSIGEMVKVVGKMLHVIKV